MTKRRMYRQNVAMPVICLKIVQGVGKWETRETGRMSHMWVTVEVDCRI